MIIQFFTIISVWMTSLSPGINHDHIAWAIASSAESIEEAALITAVAFRESSLDNSAIGDHGRSVCAMQIHGGAHNLLLDVGACIRRGTLMLRESRRVDPANPIAHYARGPRWQSEEAKRLSRDRVALAKRLLSIVP